MLETLKISKKGVIISGKEDKYIQISYEYIEQLQQYKISTKTLMSNLTISGTNVQLEINDFPEKETILINKFIRILECQPNELYLLTETENISNTKEPSFQWDTEKLRSIFNEREIKTYSTVKNVLKSRMMV